MFTGKQELILCHYFKLQWGGASPTPPSRLNPAYVAPWALYTALHAVTFDTYSWAALALAVQSTCACISYYTRRLSQHLAHIWTICSETSLAIWALCGWIRFLTFTVHTQNQGVRLCCTSNCVPHVQFSRWQRDCDKNWPQPIETWRTQWQRYMCDICDNQMWNNYLWGKTCMTSGAQLCVRCQGIPGKLPGANPLNVGHQMI